MSKSSGLLFSILSITGIIFLTFWLMFFDFKKQKTPFQNLSTEQITEKLLEQYEGPTHPGWFKQWKIMKQNDQGIIPKDWAQNIYQIQQTQMAQKVAGILTNVQELGPSNVGGRTRGFIVDDANHNRLLSAGVSGGIWNSTNDGASWAAVNDDAANFSATYLAQDPFNANVIYYSSGEPTGNSAGVGGVGVFKSTDGGQSFSLLSSTTGSDFNSIWRVVCSKTLPNTIYVGCDFNDGIHVSTDGGTTFTQYLNGSDVTDIEPLYDGSVLVAVRGDGVYKSNNGINNFVKISSGLPGTFSRIVIDFCDSVPNVVYALMSDIPANDITDVYRSNDGGNTFTNIGRPNTVAFSFPWYCLALEVKPDDPDFAVIGGVGLGYTVNGGTTWLQASTAHADHHIFKFDPDDLSKFYVGNDGGLYVYKINGVSLQILESLNNGYNVTQYYAGTFFPNSLKVYGGTQDNGTHGGTSASSAFNHIFGGDGSYCAVNQQNASVAYVSWQYGRILRADDANNQFPNFNYILNEMDADNDFSIDDGAWFINPFAINPASGNQIYFPTYSRVWFSVTSGNNWLKLTNTINNPYAVGVSNDLDPKVYIGGNNLFLAVDGALSLPTGSEHDFSSTIPNIQGDFIACLEVHPQIPTTVYATFSSISNDPRVWKIDSANTAPQWTSVSGDLPNGLPINWLEVSPFDDQIMIAATDFGVYTTSNGGTNWILEDDIPQVAVFQVKLRNDGKLFIYTHGRGIWMADIPTGNINNTPIVSGQAKLYPNPFNEIVRIESKSQYETIKIYDVKGKLIKTINANANAIQTGRLPKGAYIFNGFKNGKLVFTTKAIKQ